MRCIAAILVLASAPALQAQRIIDAGDPVNRSLIQNFDRIWSTKDSKDRAALGCEIAFIPSELGFDLRLWTTYALSIRASEFAGANRTRMTALIKVEPLAPAGETVYLARRMAIPRIPLNPPKNVRVGANGGFALGEGKYRVRLTFVDQRGRSCMKQWTFKAKAGRRNASELDPGQVADASNGWAGFDAPPAGAAARHATIVINAYPVFRRRHMASLSWRDQVTLMNVLSSVLSRSGFHSARVVAFDLQRRQVIYNEPEFSPRSFEALSDALSSVDLTTIDYATLAKGPTERQFLERTIQDLTRQGDPGEIIFISPPTRPASGSGQKNDAIWEGHARPSVLALAPNPIPEGAVIDFAKSGKARVFSIYLPSDLAAAVNRIAAHTP
jgi:hypothetical protein